MKRETKTREATAYAAGKTKSKQSPSPPRATPDFHPPCYPSTNALLLHTDDALHYTNVPLRTRRTHYR